jgi:hypothetical protein
VRGSRIEIAGRLVGEKQARPVDQRSGDGDALLLAAGKLAGGAGPLRAPWSWLKQTI